VLPECVPVAQRRRVRQRRAQACLVERMAQNPSVELPRKKARSVRTHDRIGGGPRAVGLLYEAENPATIAIGDVRDVAGPPFGVLVPSECVLQIDHCVAHQNAWAIGGIGAKRDELHSARLLPITGASSAIKSHPVKRRGIPRSLLVLVKEVAKHLLRRPVVGIAAAARTRDGRWLLVRRRDVGEWALPGGTLGWGETLRECIVRELAEEAGVDRCEIVRLAGVYSRPDRDPRFHAVTVVVECDIGEPSRQPSNPLEISEVGLFATEGLPRPLAMGMQDMLDDVLDHASTGRVSSVE